MRIALLALIAEEPRHGYDLMTEMETRSEGAYRPSPGSVYPNLQQLEDQGLIEAHKEAGKNVYTTTDAGKAEAAEQKELIDSIWSRAEEIGEWGPGSHPAAMEITRHVRQFAKEAFAAVTRRDIDPDRIREIIDRARKEIEETAP